MEIISERQAVSEKKRDGEIQNRLIVWLCAKKKVSLQSEPKLVMAKNQNRK